MTGTDGLDSLKVPELREELRKAGITGISKDTKPTLLAKLREHIASKMPKQEYRQERMAKPMHASQRHARRRKKGTWQHRAGSIGRMRRG